LEYWDVERKRYPQYDHCAVIVAEDITSRFLNVINLFNGSIPLIAIQMTALQVNDGVSLQFTKVLDEVTLGLVDEDEEVQTTDRAYWEEKGTRATVATCALWRGKDTLNRRKIWPRLFHNIPLLMHTGDFSFKAFRIFLSVTRRNTKAKPASIICTSGKS